MFFRQCSDDLKALAQAEFHEVTAQSLKRAALLDSFPILMMYRARMEARRLHIPGINRLLRLTQMSLYGIEIGKDVQLGEGVSFVHSLGTVIGGNAKIGARVRFMGNNTVGTAKDNGYPVIEDDVVVGCGARILGPIVVGCGAVIGANAVVLQDVPKGAVMAGVPARVVGMRGADFHQQIYKISKG